MHSRHLHRLAEQVYLGFLRRGTTQHPRFELAHLWRATQNAIQVTRGNRRSAARHPRFVGDSISRADVKDCTCE